MKVDSPAGDRSDAGSSPWSAKVLRMRSLLRALRKAAFSVSMRSAGVPAGATTPKNTLTS